MTPWSLEALRQEALVQQFRRWRACCTESRKRRREGARKGAVALFAAARRVALTSAIRTWNTRCVIEWWWDEARLVPTTMRHCPTRTAHVEHERAARARGQAGEGRRGDHAEGGS